MVRLDVAKFRDLEAFREEIAAFTRYVKESPPGPGFDETDDYQLGPGLQDS